MLETPHVIAAAAIAAKSQNPYIAIPLALFSHFVLDETPHWNPHFTTKEGEVKKIDKNTFRFIVADSSIALISGSVIAFSYFPDIKKVALILFCSFLAVLPDLIEAPYIFLNYKKEWLRNLLKFQKTHQYNTNLFFGIATQVVTIIASLVWIYQK